MSQTELANRMRERGHRWVQQTVVAVEKGERSLRLSEAFDLVQLLDLTRVELLGSDIHGQTMSVSWIRLSRASEQLVEAARAYDVARVQFGKDAIAAYEVEKVWAIDGDEVLDRSVEDYIQLARSRQALSDPPELASLVETLRHLYNDA